MESEMPAGIKEKRPFDGIVYSSAKMRKVLDLVEKVAPTAAAVYISGESGTGKELIARALHDRGAQRAGAFIAINCGALPEGLLESELFGHARGAFTDAYRNKRGLFEEANGGSLFLDEICETSPALQVKLLRALQEGEVRRVGDCHPIRVTGRLIFASNRDLNKLLKEGKIREDFYYRLKVFPIEIPPLRERREDILPLARHFLRKWRKKLRGKASSFSPEAAHALENYRWPGNVRELEHAVERVLIMAADRVAVLKDLPANVAAPSETPAPGGGPPGAGFFSNSLGGPPPGRIGPLGAAGPLKHRSPALA